MVRGLSFRDADDVRFTDRVDAGRRLAARLGHVAAESPVVVGLPRGGVPVAAEVARSLDAPLDVIVVRKLGAPSNPEFAMGAIGEDDVKVLDDHVVDWVGASAEQVARIEARERAELERRTEAIRRVRPRVPLAGRTVVIVDDGIATGSTARAACRVARTEGAARIVLAVPVAPHDWADRLADVADELVAVATPYDFGAVGRFYADFSPTTDETVLRLLRRSGRSASETDRPAPPDGPVGV